MAQIAPMQTTYSDTTLVKRTITDVVANISPRDTPLIANLGGLDGAASKFNFVNGNGKAVEWAEDTLYALADSITETIATNTTTLTVADAYVFHVGDIFRIDSEDIWVSAVASSTTLTVTRGLGDSTEATHADNAVCTIIGNARLEGAEVTFRGVTDKTTNYNYSQIFHEGVKVARSARVAMPQYGVADELEYQSEKLVPSMLRLVERAMFYGDRQAGSASAPRQMGGLGEFITDNTVNYTTSFTQANVEDLLELCFADGGLGPWIMPVDTTQMQAAKNLLDNTLIARAVQREHCRHGREPLRDTLRGC